MKKFMAIAQILFIVLKIKSIMFKLGLLYLLATLTVQCQKCPKVKVAITARFIA